MICEMRSKKKILSLLVTVCMVIGLFPMPVALAMLPGAKSIEITKMPNKTVYTAGETFDPAGMVGHVTYYIVEDEHDAPYEGYERAYGWIPEGPLSVDDTFVTITFYSDGLTATTTVPITVIAAATPAQHEHIWSDEWSSDASNHWHECGAEGCDATENSDKNGYGAHDYDNDTDTTCNTCDYVRVLPVLPPYSGTADKPTLNTKKGGNVTLDPVTVDGEEVEYGWSSSNDKSTAANWQASPAFTGLTAGDYYFFARVKAKEGTHSGGGVSGASDKVTVYAAPKITGYSGTLDSLTIGTAITEISPVVIDGTGVYSTYTMASGTLPAGLNFNTADGKISGTPTTYAAAGGSVTVTVTDSEGVTSAAYTLNYGAVGKKAQSITAEDVTATYGDTDKSVSAAASGTISYAVKTGSENYIDVNSSNGKLTIKKAGEAWVVVTAAATEEYAQATKDVKVTISRKNVTAGMIGSVGSQPYNGSAITPKPIITDVSALVEGTDFTYDYADNTYVGTSAKVKISGQGNYTGTAEKVFSIIAAAQTPTIKPTAPLTTGGNTLDLRTLVSGYQGDTVTFTIASGDAAELESDGYTLKSTSSIGEVRINVGITSKDVNSDGKPEYEAYTSTNAITVTVTSKTDGAVEEDGTSGLSVDKVVATTVAGDNNTIVVTSKIPATNEQIDSFQIDITFDTDKLEVVETDVKLSDLRALTEDENAAGTVTKPAAANKAGKFSYMIAAVTSMPLNLSGGHTASIKFKVKDTASVGETTVSINKKVFGYNGSTLTIGNDWTTSANISIITDYISTVNVSGVAVETGVALPTVANLTATGLSADTAAITWDPTDTTAENKDYNFSITLNALKDDAQEYRFDETVTVTGLEDFVEVTATPSEDGATLTITGKYLSRMLGDVNGDDAVDILDIQQILNYLAGEESVLDQDAVAMKVADVNSDNSVDILDIQQILNYLAGEESVFD